MTNPNDSINGQLKNELAIGPQKISFLGGLTKRELAAFLIHAGNTANPEFTTLTDEDMAQISVEAADALIKELNK